MTRWTVRPQAGTDIDQLLTTTPARIGIGRAGVRPPTQDWLLFRCDHALARDAVKSEFSRRFIEFAENSGFPVVQTLAVDKRDFIQFPPKGKRVHPDSIAALKKSCPQNKQVHVTISGGLSARAIETNLPEFLPALLSGLAQEGITHGTPVVVPYGRVAAGDHLTDEMGMRLSIILIGERPGLSAANSMSAYLTYNAGPSTISSDRTVVSNIHPRGMLPLQAAQTVVQLAKRILQAQVSGVRFQSLHT